MSANPISIRVAIKNMGHDPEAQALGRAVAVGRARAYRFARKHGNSPVDIFDELTRALLRATDECDAIMVLSSRGVVANTYWPSFDSVHEFEVCPAS